MLIVDGAQDTLTDAIADAGPCWTVTEAFPKTEESWVLVAMTFTVVADAGAVSKPLAEIVPALADHVTAVL